MDAWEKEVAGGCGKKLGLGVPLEGACCGGGVNKLPDGLIEGVMILVLHFKLAG